MRVSGVQAASTGAIRWRGNQAGPTPPPLVFAA